jgi:hypothetical protein
MDKINIELRAIIINKELIKHFSKVKNEREQFSKGNYKFLKSLKIIVQGDYVDFDVQIDFIKRNIHLNLIDHTQIERLISVARILEYNF